MVQRTLKIDRTPSGIATMSAGGGAETNTYSATTILKVIPVGFNREKSVYDLKNAGLIKTAGHLACSLEQAIIPVEIGDVVIYLNGKLPLSDLNPDAEVTGYKITAIDNVTAIGEQVTITHADIPQSVIIGAGKYHNREGNYFCYPVIQEG
jgi:hypothetical protein